MRAFAAVSVVGVHTAFFSGFSKQSSLAEYTARLEVGVSVFFVISGFLLYRPFVVAHLSGRDAPETLKFWVRRLFRIVPAYWLALTVAAYVLHDVVLPSGVGQVLIHYFFLQIYFPTAIDFGVGPSWSLCTEMSFYIFLPLYAAGIAFRRRTASMQLKWELLGLVTMAAVSFLFRVWDLTQHGHCGTDCLSHPAFTSTMVTWLPSFLDLFAVGMFLAVLSAWFVAHDSEPAWLRHRAMPSVSWGLAIVVFFWVSHLGIDPQPIYSATPATNILKQTLYGLFALLLVAPAVFGPQDEGAVRRLLRLAPVAWLGVVSYGIYLWHATMIQVFFSVTGAKDFAVPFWVLFGVVLVAATIVASISYLGMEQPLLEFANRITRRKPATMASLPEPTVLASSFEKPHTFWDTLTTALERWALRVRSWRDSFGVHWFLPALAVIVVIAIGIRVWFAVEWTFGRDLAGDAAFFHQSAAALASGRGFSSPGILAPHRLMPTAEHPPFFPMVLATFDLLGFHSIDAQRVLLAVLGSLGVFLTGLVGYRVSGQVVRHGLPLE